MINVLPTFMKVIPKEVTKNSKKMKGIPKELEGIPWNSNGVYGIPRNSKEFVILSIS